MCVARIVALSGLVAVGGGACGRVEFDLRPDADGTPPACDPTAPFGTPVLIPSLNSAASDGTLRLFPDELSGYYWSSRVAAADLYFVARPDIASPFTLRPVQGTDVAAEYNPAPSPDGTLLVFRRSSVAGEDLMVASRVTADSFSNVTLIPELDSVSRNVEPFFQPDGTALYFSADRTGGGDLYRSSVTGTTFSSPALVSELSTPDSEGDPAMSADGLTLYFRSNRPAPLMGFNIYVTTRASLVAPFAPPVLVPNVNTDTDDGPSWISPDDCRLYLSTGPSGDPGVYVATRSGG